MRASTVRGPIYPSSWGENRDFCLVGGVLLLPQYYLYLRTTGTAVYAV